MCEVKCDGDDVVAAALLSLGAGAVCCFGTGVNGTGCGKVIMVKYVALHWASSGVDEEELKFA